MNRCFNIGRSCAMVALIGLAAASLAAQQYPAGGGRANPPAAQGGAAAQPAQQPAPPANPPARGGRRGGGAPAPAMEGTQQEAGRATNVGTNTPGAPAPVPAAVTTIGTVHIAKAVKADGQDLKPGTYVMRMTEREASPAAPGMTPQYERWAEFLQGGQVKGREVIIVVTPDAAKQVLKDKWPASGGYRADVLKGGDYYRLWYNKGGTHYLVHFNI